MVLGRKGKGRGLLPENWVCVSVGVELTDQPNHRSGEGRIYWLACRELGEPGIFPRAMSP